SRSDIPLTRAGAQPSGFTACGIILLRRSVWVRPTHRPALGAWTRTESSHRDIVRLPSLFPDKLRDDVIGDRFDLASRQARGMRVGGGVGEEFRGGAAVTVLVLLIELIEVWPFGSRAPACDHFNQLIPIENGLVQIGCLPGRSWIAPAVAIDAVTELAIGLV